MYRIRPTIQTTPTTAGAAHDVTVTAKETGEPTRAYLLQVAEKGMASPSLLPRQDCR
jgi:hypothetical protein